MSKKPRYEPRILAFACNSAFFFGLFSPLADPRKETARNQGFPYALKNFVFLRNLGEKETRIDLLEKRRCCIE